MHYGFSRYLQVAIVRLSRRSILDHVHQRRLEYFRSFLKTKYPSFQYAVYTDHIVVLMGSEEKDLYDVPYFMQNEAIFSENDLYLCVSSSYEDVFETRTYYDRAIQTLDQGIALGTGTRVFFSG